MRVAPNPLLLLIDDDVTLLAALGQQLEDAGYQVVKASEVREGELLAVEHVPDLVLLEVAASSAAGWNLLERLAPLQPVIVLSRLGLEEQVVRGLDAGAADYLAKPYRSAELLARIRARLAASQRLIALAHPTGNGVLPAASTALAPQRQPETTTTEPLRADEAAIWVQRAPAAPVVPQLPTLPPRAEDEEPVFIDSASEARLLATPDTNAAAALNDDLAHLALGARLNAARRRRHISLVQVENDTRVRMWYLQAMEDEKFALLPRGEGSEQMVRTYASYLSLDAAQAVEEFHRLHFNPSPQPLAALGGVPQARQLPRWLPITLAILLAVAVSIGGIALFDPAGAQALLANIVAWLYSLIP